MNARLLRKRWRRALETNLKRAAKLLRRRGPLNADAVHDLRVALRRARLLLQLRSKHRDRQRTKRFRAAARKIMDAFAPVRDLDVTLEWAHTQHASPALLARLLRQRATLCRRAERELARFRPKARANRLKDAGKTDPDILARRFERWRAAMMEHSRVAARRARQLSTLELHALRRDIRRWRYLSELPVPARAVRRNQGIVSLIHVQEALGAIQNLEVILAALPRCGRTREVTALKRGARLNLAVSRAAALRELQLLGAEHGRT